VEYGFWQSANYTLFGRFGLVTGIGIEGKNVPDLLPPESVTHLPKAIVRVLNDRKLLFLVQDLPIPDLI
jgi:hypothetical protein